MAGTLQALVKLWCEKLDIAKKVRDDEFGKYARECMMFFDPCDKDMWSEMSRQHSQQAQAASWLDDSAVKPLFRISVNPVSDAVRLFGPALYHRNPHIMVQPRQQPDVLPGAYGLDSLNPQHMEMFNAVRVKQQMDRELKQSIASVHSLYSTWLQAENNKITEARNAINEAIITGLGLLETKIHQPVGSQSKMVRSQYLCWEDLLIDPDARYWRDVQWIAMRRIEPVNLVERKFGIETGALQAQYRSADGQAYGSMEGRHKPRHDYGSSFDLVEYWEIYSKNGMGHRMENKSDALPTVTDLLGDLDAFGDFCYLAIVKGHNFPLSLNEEVVLSGDFELVDASVKWPIPTQYLDEGWPVKPLMFYEKPGRVWPISPCKPAIPEIRFVNWCMSFLADKSARAGKDIIAIAESAAKDIQEQLTKNTGPYTVVQVAEMANMPLNQIVQMLQAPTFSIDLWKMVAEVQLQIDKRLGLTELVYGLSSRQMRSAAEANVRQSQTSIRPDDMATRVEDWLSSVAKGEIQAAVWGIDPQDIAACLGEEAGMLWQQVQSEDLDRVVRDYEFTVEAGSARKPNIEGRKQDLIEFAQYALPVLQQFAMVGQTQPINTYFKLWGDVHQFDTSGMMVVPPPQEPTDGSDTESA